MCRERVSFSMANSKEEDGMWVPHIILYCDGFEKPVLGSADGGNHKNE
jgi:hypothetical protein